MILSAFAITEPDGERRLEEGMDEHHSWPKSGTIPEPAQRTLRKATKNLTQYWVPAEI